jgi:hypothetical protein
MPPRWTDARYESLNPAIRKLYDDYVEAYKTAGERARKLQEEATSEWLLNHPNGIEGKFISFNVNGGRLRWVMANKRPLGDHKTVGEDVPSLNSPRNTEDASTVHTYGRERAARTDAKKSWNELEDYQLGLTMIGADEQSWAKLSYVDRVALLRGLDPQKTEEKPLTAKEKLALKRAAEQKQQENNRRE